MIEYRKASANLPHNGDPLTEALLETSTIVEPGRNANANGGSPASTATARTPPPNSAARTRNWSKPPATKRRRSTISASAPANRLSAALVRAHFPERRKNHHSTTLTSVFAKSFPTNSSGSPRDTASA